MAYTPEDREGLGRLAHPRRTVGHDHRLHRERRNGQAAPASPDPAVQRDTANHHRGRAHQQCTLHHSGHPVSAQFRPPPAQLQDRDLDQTRQRIPYEADRGQVRIPALQDVARVGHPTRRIRVEQVVAHRQQIADPEVQREQRSV